jgi:formate hydrogenlyase transcriptional activator
MTTLLDLRSPLPQIGSSERCELLLDLAKAANSYLDFDQVMRALGESLRRHMLKLRFAAVLIIDGDFYSPYALHISGLDPIREESFGKMLARHTGIDSDKIPARVPMKNSVLQHISQTREPYVCPNLMRRQRFAEDPRLLTYGYRAYVLCPLIVRGRVLGAIQFVDDNPKDYSADEVLLFREIAEVAAVALANALAYLQIETLQHKLQSENLVLKENIAESAGFEELIGSSSGLKRVLAAIEKVAATDSTVLILGETGTGKELIAKAIHKHSSRSDKPMVKVNCAAIPESLIASEIFGHEKGAFTGALQRRIGRFEMANESSLFLDEVGELPLEMQVTLLRVLQEREFERVGGSHVIRTNARLIAATNGDLVKAIAENRFRSDLYYRLNVFPIHVPALRKRSEDVPILVEYFTARCAERIGKKIRHIEKATMDLLVSYQWPGNIRELQNVIERGVILTDAEVLRIDPAVLDVGSEVAPADVGIDALHGQQRDLIESTLAETKGRVAGPNGAAARLRLPASTLESKIRALKIDKHKYRSPSH